MKCTILTIFFVCFCLVAHATPQVPDILIFHGDTLPLFTNPLEDYFNSKGNEGIERGCNSSSCWRGYVATWEIRNDSLFMLNIQPCDNFIVAGVVTGLECDESDTSQVMRFLIDEFKGKENFADWYSGDLISPQGRLIEYVHMGYRSTYERELRLNVDNGILVRTQIKENEFTNTKLLDQFNYELIQDSLFHYMAKRLDWEKVGGEMICDGWYSVTLTRDGRVKKVKYDPAPDESKWEAFWWNLRISDCRRILKKSVADLNFKKMLTHGGQVPKSVRLEIFYNDSTNELTLER